MKPRYSFLFMATLACAAAGGAHAQIVREDGAGSIARVLDGPAGAFFDDFTFRSMRPQILFATIAGDLYQSAGRPAPEASHDPAAAEDGNGCADEGGPGGYCLQVLDADANIVCWADRPVRPGWQRDPRLACALWPRGRSGEVFTLRVSLRGEGENPCGPDAGGAGFYPDPAPDAPDHAYMLDVSLRDIAPEGAIRPAVAASTNRF